MDYFDRCVDCTRTFIIWPHGFQQVHDFLSRLTGIYLNIKFTMRTEKDDKLPFLDILTKRKHDGTFVHGVYRTELYVNTMSWHLPVQKISILKNTWTPRSVYFWLSEPSHGD